MKHSINKSIGLAAILSCLISLAGCYKDDSTIASSLISDITIADFQENGYTIISFADNYLDITPVVETEYKESELTYKWYLIDKSQEVLIDQDSEDPYEMELIGEEKTLHYNVRLIPGEYTVVCQVSASNGYTVYKTTTLNCITLFSNGFYILKETVDGDTELDLFNPSSDTFMENVITNVHGEPIQGVPQNLSTAYNHGYIDDNTNEMASSNMVTVTTKDGKIRVMRTSDLKIVMDNSSLLFSSFEEGEVPYRIISFFWINMLTSNKGVRSQYQASLQTSASGRYGVTNGIPVGTDLAYDERASGLFLWDPTTHKVVYCDYNATCTYGTREDNGVANLSQYECMFIGSCTANGNVVYVLRNRMNVTFIMSISSNFGAGWKVEQLTPIHAFAPNFNKAASYKICTQEATLVYGLLDNNEIWAYDFVNNIEKQIVPEGIGDDEKITYISDQYAGYDATNNFFIVGTEKNDTYTLRFYTNFGGQPDGAPKYVITGKGHPKAIHHTCIESYYTTTFGMQD